MVKQITVISGKGGTGKTMISSSFAALAENAVIADCDVDAADMHLILKPDVLESHDFYGLKVANIDKEQCIDCGECVSYCRFDAIGKFNVVDNYRCEGCAVCEYICSENAISMVEKKAGEYYCSSTRFGPLVYAKLGIGEEASGKLVSNVRRRASELAEETDRELIIIDGPPGTGCSVIASITGSDLVLVVTEPTISGIHDLDRVIRVAHHFRIPAVVCINKYDLNMELSQEISDYCDNNDISVIGKLPYDSSPVGSMIKGKTVVEYCENSFSREIRSIWSVVMSMLESRDN